MNLTRATATTIVSILENVLLENKFADKVIEKAFKENTKRKNPDRQFIAQTTYGIIRNYRYLYTAAKCDKDNFWKILGAWLMLNKIPMPRWDEFGKLNSNNLAKHAKEARTIRKYRESLPDWLDELGEKELGDQWDKEIKALNENPTVVLRVNTLKTTKEELIETLRNEMVETKTNDEFPDAVFLPRWKNVFRLQAFKDGLFESQDAASQEVARYLEVSPGMRVIDACAGTGGKTLHLAALMNNKGRIIAMDTEEWKLNELKLRARRCGVSNLELKTIDSTKVIKRQANTADRLLLDTPCSGLGVLRRNPDAKWKLTPEYLGKLHQLQATIINDYSVLLKKDGLMVYSTCSILPSENQQQVAKFLDAHSNFKLIREKTILPSEGYDGFYMALLKKVDV